MYVPACTCICTNTCAETKRSIKSLGKQHMDVYCVCMCTQDWIRGQTAFRRVYCATVLCTRVRARLNHRRNRIWACVDTYPCCCTHVNARLKIIGQTAYGRVCMYVSVLYTHVYARLKIIGQPAHRGSVRPLERLTYAFLL